MTDLYPGFRAEDTIKFQDSKGNIFWESNPGPQTWVLRCPYDETLLGGSRGGGKTAVIPAWFAMGDETLPKGDPARESFLNDHDFRGLILREQYQDLKEFVDQAMDFFRHFACKPADDPVVFQFKSGAKIYTGHLNDEEAYNKYRGWNITKIAIEELTRVAKLSQYMRLFGSRRSVARRRGNHIFPPLRTQIASTTNPDGPGAAWVRARFVKVYSGGQLIPWNTPMRDPITEKTRIFIPARLNDNPHLGKDYVGMLLAQDPVTQRQWIYGDWDAAAGSYFKDYRPHGPMPNEPAWARHLIDPVELKPWWYRWGGGDWGYDHPAAFHKCCLSQGDGRIHVYDELVVRQVGSYELGVMLAKWWAPELEAMPDHQVTIYLDPKAFSKTDETKTQAEQMALGIQEVLGPYSAFVMRYNDDERAIAMKDPGAAAKLFEYRKAQLRGRMGITLNQANNDRIAGHAYLRDLLRWRPLLANNGPDMDHAKALFQTKGVAAYEEYVASFRDHKPEVLPKLVLWKKCKGADRCLQSAVHDEDPRAEDVRKMNAENGKNGDDELDSLRYGAFAYREIQKSVPKSYYVAEKMEQAQSIYTDPAILGQISAMQGARYDQQYAAPAGSFNLSVRPSLRNWRN